MEGRILKSIRRKVRENFLGKAFHKHRTLKITPEAMYIMEADFLSMADVKHAIEKGQIEGRILSFCGSNEFCGYQLCGPTVYGEREVYVSCRILDSGKLLITEVYAK